MPLELANFNNFGLSILFAVKAFFVLLLVFYNVFGLLLFRQTQLMAKTLPTTLSPILMFVSIVHLGISLSLIFIVAGVF